MTTNARRKIAATMKKSIFLLLVGMMALAVTNCGVFDTIKARKLAREANKLYNDSKYLEAVAIYKQAIALDKDIPNIYLNLGYTYYNIYDLAEKGQADQNAAEEAVTAFDEHLKKSPQDENARNFQIKILLKASPSNKKLADRAYQTFVDMLAKDPSDKEARQYLVTLFIDCKRYEDAVKFFEKDLQKNPNDVETMKLLAIVADKSDRIQEAVDWYWRRADTTAEPEKKAMYFYEVGTYAWNLLHYAPDRATGVNAVKLADQGIEATLKAISMKDKYAEAMIYGNLLYLKRLPFETEEQGRYWDQNLAFDLRTEAGKILAERKKGAEGEQPKAEGEPSGAKDLKTDEAKKDTPAPEAKPKG
jgi:tetratricopeptide (TPR) repeat protein